MTITHDALDLTVQPPSHLNWPAQESDMGLIEPVSC